MKRTNRITDQTAPPKEVLGVPIERDSSRISRFDKARATHGPHMSGKSDPQPGSK